MNSTNITNTIGMATKEKEQIVVIGGGFAGLNFVKKIDKSKYNVLLIDKHNFHSFPPLFYQIASSGLDASNISFPFRREFRKQRAKGVHFNLGKVTNINFNEKTVTTDLETVHYDKLVIAAGATNNFFGNEELKDKVYTIKSTPQSIRCRNDILDLLEQASICKDREKKRKLLNFVVVGGGPTGVEIAGAIGEMKRYIIKREYPTIDPDDVNITLIEGMDRVLNTMSEESSVRAKKYLHDLLVDVRTGLIMKEYKDGKVYLSDGSELDASLVIWTAGIIAETFECEGSQLPTQRGRRIPVNECNEVAGLTDVYALGDICIMNTDPNFPNGHPQLAQPALQQAANLAKNLNQGTRRPFLYNDKGSMATVGRNRAVVELKKYKFGGFLAWLTWMFIHLITILGMRNKLSVLIDWLWAYFTYNTSLRILVHPSKFPKTSHSYD